MKTTTKKITKGMNRDKFSKFSPNRGRPGGGSRNKREEGFYTKEAFFLSRMGSILQVDPRKARKIFSQRIASTIRLNNLAADPAKIEELLERKANCDLESVDWSPNTFIVNNKDKSDLSKLEAYHRGLFYIQSLSSMLPPIILDPQEDDVVLDMCAAPGSKTTQLAALMNNKGTIFATDENFLRIQKLEGLLSQFHVKNVTAKMMDATLHGKMTPERYDKILLDAPCSNEGLIYMLAPKPLRFWNVKKVKLMARTQERLIESAFKALKPGGTLVYSTCSLEPVENEGVVSYLVNKFRDAEIQPIDLFKSQEFAEYHGYIRRGITHWSNLEFARECALTVRIVPGSKMQGFFVAKIKKKA